MCGRYTLRTPAHRIAEAFGLSTIPDLPPRYNVAPSQPVAAVRYDSDRNGRQFAFLRWGLVPSWADDQTIGNRLINARAETVAAKPAFRRAFKARRCLVPADGFYEWQKTGGGKRPFYIRLADDRPFALAGLWETWEREGEEIESCAIVTTQANELVRRIHDRMPVIIPPGDYDLWLDPAVPDTDRLTALLGPFPAEHMTAYAVGTLVNNPRNDAPECLTRID